MVAAYVSSSLATILTANLAEVQMRWGSRFSTLCRFSTHYRLKQLLYNAIVRCCRLLGFSTTKVFDRYKLELYGRGDCSLDYFVRCLLTTTLILTAPVFDRGQKLGLR